ncbi:protein Dr1 isoform X1 [Pygocentrus nattereri]|uniref:protein Dr1 isoform X1 n=3 Tax=Characoidei TaxID=1489739 RepID=UPI0008147552|nr:protein Dr1 isoform X1 [Pygocentrus nattereri]
MRLTEPRASLAQPQTKAGELVSFAHTLKYPLLSYSAPGFSRRLWLVCAATRAAGAGGRAGTAGCPTLLAPSGSFPLALSGGLRTYMMASSSGNDDDLTIPRAAINKMIKETLPNVRVANDARELVVNCCTEFIHLISSEANEICNKSEKKTISPEHVINALESLGFGSYIAEVKDVLQECKTVALKRRKASSRLENLGIPEEELLRQQQELFAKARQQQAELAQQEWLQMQQAAQQAQLAAAAAASASAAQQAGSSQDEDEEDDM